MKKITFSFFLLFLVLCNLKTNGQTLNQDANWPNSNWVITGSYETDPDAFEADPTAVSNFAFDDDDAGNGNVDEIAAESPVIDLTAAQTAGETWILVSVEYFFRIANTVDVVPDDFLAFQYWNADTSSWETWAGQIPATEGSGGANTDDFCTPEKTAYVTIPLNIATFTSTQLSGFKYRIFYDDDGNNAGGNWEYGFCFDSPVINSQVPPSCLEPSDVSVDEVTAYTADVSWTSESSESEWDIVYDTAVGFDPDNEGTTVVDDDGIAGTQLTGLDASTEYEFYLRADCGDTDGVSEWVGPFTFTTATDTPPNCDAEMTTPADLSEDVDIDQDLIWSAASGEPTSYNVTVGTTSGGTDVVDNVNVGDVTVYDLGTLAYGTEYFVTITPENSNGVATGCTEYTFTTEADPSVVVDCGAGPVSENFCYENNSEFEAIYTSSDGSPLTLNINNGFLEACCDELIVLDSDGTELYNDGGDISGLTFQSTGDQITVQVSSDGSVNCQANDYDPIDYTVSCATCANPAAEYEVVSDCNNGPQFLVEVNVTDLGDATDLNISDNQGSADQTASSVDVYTFGPYANGTEVEIDIENNQDSNCVISSNVLTQAYCSEITVDCAVGPATQNFCYDDDSTFEVVYTSSDGSSLNLNVNGGFLEACCDEFVVLDSDGTELYNDGGDISGLTFQSTGDQITVQVSSDGSVNCQANDYDSIDYNVSCATCSNPEATYTVVEDCINGPQFFVEVDLTSIGDATDVDISDNQGSDVETATEPAVFTFGPYTNGTLVEIEIENNQDVNCQISSGELTQETCVNNYVDCEVGPVNTVFCYENGQTEELTYISTDGSPINLVINSGQVENGWDEFIVLDSDGTQLYNGYGNAGDVSGVGPFQSSGDQITVQVVADGINSCVEDDYTPIDITASCATCENPDVSYEVVSDCDSGVDQFFVEVNVVDLGSAGSLSVEDDQGSAVETVVEAGIVEFGPFPNGTDVVITVSNDDDGNCVVSSGALTQTDCPPDNDLCDNAIVASVNGDQFCEVTTPGTLAAANGSNVSVSCGGNVAQDVWFEFTATSTTHMIALLDEAGNSASDLYHSVYEGGDCNNLTEVYCSEEFDNGGNSPNIVADNLTIGSTYKIRVFDTSISDQDFNLCITTPDYKDNVDCSELEPFCAPTDESGNPEPLIFPNGYFYLEESVAEEGPDYGCLGSEPNPAWFYLQVQESGDLEFEIVQNTAFDETGATIGDGLDVDFIVYGPFNSVEDNCEDLTNANIVDCSYSAAAIEDMVIPGAQADEVYIVLITNFNQSPGYISLGQTNFGETGGGTTDCTILDETVYACEGEDVILTSEFPNALAYVWYEYNPDTEENEIIEGEETSTLEVSEDGVYTLVSFDQAGTPSEEVFTVVYSENPDVDLMLEPGQNGNSDFVSLCGVSQISLDATPSNASLFDPVEYSWMDSDGNEISTMPTVDFSEEGTYTVEVIGTILDEDGFPTEFTCAFTKTFDILNSDFTVSLGSDQDLCDESSYTIESVVTGEDASNASYVWEDSNGVISGETSSSLVVTEDGDYMVTVEIDGCTATSSVNVVLNESPSLSSLEEEIVTCSLSDAILDATPSNFTVAETTYSWTYEGSSIAETGAIVNASDYGYGSYEVTAYADSPDCSTTISIAVIERDDIGVSLISDQSSAMDLQYCSDLSDEVPSYELVLTAELSNVEASEVDFVWYENGNVLSGETGSSYTVVYDSEGDYNDTYEVEIVLGGCSAFGAIDTDVSITPYENGCVITEGLSPNSSPGQNDCMDLSFLDDRTGIRSLKVYNRHGRLVYDQSNYVNSFCGQDQDGEDLQTGTYYYVLEFSSEDPVFGNVKKGWVYINREVN
ncbi:T9SS type B sorting domain-containing protein [Mesonia aquimarina]|uniref:T9SS type B sorting domain-containing protein n=1 Tax=Mesonia aquimarina TaxID=1504967 RepID=UPI000EF62D53|nr:gliding motility-associated C-terminal domain-containing protein [Mesonia aquimarina]